MIFIRFFFLVISTFTLLFFLPNPGAILWEFSSCSKSEHFDCYYSYLNWGLIWKAIVVTLWVTAWASLELLVGKGHEQPRPRFLTHLAYGPVAVLLLSISSIIFTDVMLFEYSRWQIVRYIHSNASLEHSPSFSLHNNYRHWCGNGYAAQQYALYGATPVPYFDDSDPAVRVRALRASMHIYDWVNHPADGPSIDVLRKAIDDPDPLVRKVAAEFQRELEGPCLGC
jgi:hypothetical protein